MGEGQGAPGVCVAPWLKTFPIWLLKPKHGSTCSTTYQAQWSVKPHRPLRRQSPYSGLLREPVGTGAPSPKGQEQRREGAEDLPRSRCPSCTTPS